MSAPKKRKKIKVDTPIVFFLKYSIESLLWNCFYFCFHSIFKKSFHLEYMQWHALIKRYEPTLF